MKFFILLGDYLQLMLKVFKRPKNNKIFFKKLVLEMYEIGVGSLGIVFIISIFIGAILTIQVAVQGSNPLFPAYLISYGVRESIVLEFSSTVIALILSGKIGSQIASEIGTMRVTEQIDALEIMGVNSSCYLILPKVIATMVINPFLTIISMFIGIIGGWGVALLTSAVDVSSYIAGLHYSFMPFYIFYAITKSIVFAFVITTVSAYHGYYTEGGALQVGRSSTKAVVYCSIVILLLNVIITQLMLA